MQVLIKLAIPNPGTCAPNPGKEVGTSIEEDVRKMLELIDSYHESAIEWRAIRRFYTDLCRAKQSPRVKNLRKMIRPVLAKYGYHVE